VHTLETLAITGFVGGGVLAVDSVVLLLTTPSRRAERTVTGLAGLFTAAEEHALPWRTLEEARAAAAAFLDPLLGGHDGVWDPARWRWSPHE
jgi:hypothetical protein